MIRLNKITIKKPSGIEIIPDIEDREEKRTFDRDQKSFVDNILDLIIDLKKMIHLFDEKAPLESLIVDLQKMIAIKSIEKGIAGCGNG